jgi:hypothetical protein
MADKPKRKLPTIYVRASQAVHEQRVWAARSAMWNAVRVQAINAPEQLAAQLDSIADVYHLAGADILALKDAAGMLRDIAEGYDG